MSYEIAVACDVRLGELVRSDPTVSQINIYPEAIAQTLIELENDAQHSNDEIHSLLFVAEHFDTTNSQTRAKSVLYGQFSREIPRDKKSEIQVVSQPNIHVEIGGGPYNRINMNTDEQRAYWDGGLKKSVWEPVSFTQSTAVHELSHANDYYHVDKSIFGRLKSLRESKVGRQAGTLVLGSQATSLSLVYAYESMDFGGQYQSVANIGVQIAGLVLGGALVSRWRENPDRAHKRYLKEPGEIRAREYGAKAAYYPLIISVE